MEKEQILEVGMEEEFNLFEEVVKKITRETWVSKDEDRKITGPDYKKYVHFFSKQLMYDWYYDPKLDEYISGPNVRCESALEFHFKKNKARYHLHVYDDGALIAVQQNCTTALGFIKRLMKKLEKYGIDYKLHDMDVWED